MKVTKIITLLFIFSLFVFIEDITGTCYSFEINATPIVNTSFTNETPLSYYSSLTTAENIASLSSVDTGSVNGYYSKGVYGAVLFFDRDPFNAKISGSSGTSSEVTRLGGVISDFVVKYLLSLLLSIVVVKLVEVIHRGGN